MTSTTYHAWGREPHVPGTWSIYAVCDPETDRVVYVGATGQNPYKRFSQHLVAIRGTQKQSRLYHWARSLPAGLEPKFRVLERDVPAYEWEAAERRWIARINPGLNDQEGGMHCS